MRTELRWLALCCLGACQNPVESEPPQAPKRVRCGDVEASLISDTIEVRGTLAPLPERDAQLAPQVSGRVLRIEVREGDPVHVGQRVARIDDAALLDAAAESEAALARARAEHRNAQTTLARVQRVFERGIAARQEVDDASAHEASANAAEVEAEAAARVAQRQVERATLKSPLDGVVLHVWKRAGELVDGTPATPVVEIADNSVLELVADVPVQDLVRVVPGASARVTFAALAGRSWAGQVSRVAPAVDRATGIGSLRVRLELGAAPRPPVGIFGEARIVTGEARRGLRVPSAALRNAIGLEGEVVVCGTDSVAHVRRVRAEPAHEGWVAVQGELAAGEHVLIEPVLGVAEGEKIEVRR
jgi:RND family efflux transporter MFP subunit